MLLCINKPRLQSISKLASDYIKYQCEKDSILIQCNKQNIHSKATMAASNQHTEYSQ